MLKKYAAIIKVAAIIDNEVDYNRIVAEITAQAADDRVEVTARKVVKYNPEFVYARFKAIGCLEIDGPNANWDAFPYVEFLDSRPGYGYQSFVGKHAFVEHASDNINNSIGDLYGAYLNRFNINKFSNKEWAQLNDDERAKILITRASHEDGSVEVLMAIDRKSAPRIARMIETDSPTGCSMGTNIEYYECTVFCSRAYVEEQYCPHIKFSKGQNLLIPAQQISNLIAKGTLKPEWVPFILSRKEDIKAVKTASRKMVYAKAFEVNYGLSFFELSVVANPAFNKGYKLEKIASIKKPSFRQLKPLVYVGDHPVEVIFNVTDKFYDDVLQAQAQNIESDIVEWSREDRMLFDRDPEIARAALQSGNVLEVLANKANAPHLIGNDIDLVPSDDEGFYNVTNPEELLQTTFAKVKSRKIAGVVGSQIENYHACAICQNIFDRRARKVTSFTIKDFDKFGICVKCELAEEEQIMAHSKKNENDNSKKTAEYENDQSGGLPSTAEFTGDKGVESREGETELYHGWAEKGSGQIEGEKKYRPTGTIFIDAIVAKKNLNDRASRIQDLRASVETLLKRTKLALGPPDDFIKEMKDGPKMAPGLGEDNGEDVEGLAIAIELEPADVPTILENTKEDLELIVEDLKLIGETVGVKENEAIGALAHKLRWSKRHAYGVKKVADDADAVITEAVSAIEDAIMKLNKAYDIYRGQSDEESSEENNEINNNKPKSDGGDNDMSKETRLSLGAGDIELLQKLANVVANSPQVEKVAMEDEEKKEEAEEKKEEAEEKKEEAEEKKEDDEKKKDEEKKEAGVKTAETKEAAAMPPTGARDPGDYGEAGAIESHEMNRWWNDMYPEYEKMKSEERQKSLNDPETKVELLTGDVGSREGASDSPQVGESTDAPTIYAGAVIVKKFSNAWSPRGTFYGVVKLAEDGTVENAFTSNFNDVAGEDGGKSEFETFTSDNYAGEVVNTVKDRGIEAARKEMNGKVAQLEGITPGKTSKTPQALYDTQENEKDSNQARDGMRPDPEHGHGKEGEGEGEYYGKAFGDKGYASELENAHNKIASLEHENNDLKVEKKSDLIAKRAIHLARVAASRGICEFSLTEIEKQAREYIILDDNGLNAVKSHMEKLPVVNQRALEAYQIPEAEEMGAGVIHNQLTSVRDVRYEGGKGEDVAPEGIQPAVHDNAKLSAEEQEHIRKQAAGIVPQMHTNVIATEKQVSNGVEIPDVTKYFSTTENMLKRAGKYEEYKHLLNRRRY